MFSNNIAGVDIGASSVKVAQCVWSGASLKKVKSAILEYDFFLEEFADPQLRKIALADTIKRAMLNAGIKSGKVAIALSAEEVMTHSFEMPLLEADEVLSAVRLEAQQIFYSDLRGMYLDYSSRDIQTEDGRSATKGIIATTQRRIVDEYIDILDRISCEVVVVDIASLANINCFMMCSDVVNKESGVAALLDIGAKTSRLSLIDFSGDDFIRDIKWGTSDLINDMASHQKVSAEKVKALLMDGEGDKLQGAFLSPLVEELLDSIHYYEIRNKEKKVTAFYVTGAIAKNKSVSDVLSGELSMGVYQWNALEKIQKLCATRLSPENDALRSGMRLTTALGLALRVYD